MSTEKTNEKQDMKPTSQEKDQIPPLHREEDIKEHKEEADKLNESAEEYGGQDGPDPTRFGDWEKGGRCTDF